MAIFTGAGVAIVTPFNEDGSINYDRLDELIEFHCEHKNRQHCNLRYNRRICYHDRRRAYAVCKIHN